MLTRLPVCLSILCLKCLNLCGHIDLDYTYTIYWMKGMIALLVAVFVRLSQRRWTHLELVVNPLDGTFLSGFAMKMDWTSTATESQGRVFFSLAWCERIKSYSLQRTQYHKVDKSVLWTIDLYTQWYHATIKVNRWSSTPIPSKWKELILLRQRRDYRDIRNTLKKVIRRASCQVLNKLEIDWTSSLAESQSRHSAYFRLDYMVSA